MRARLATRQACSTAPARAGGSIPSTPHARKGLHVQPGECGVGHFPSQPLAFFRSFPSPVAPAAASFQTRNATHPFLQLLTTTARLHLRTLLFALALWACSGSPATVELHADASPRAAPTIGVAGAQPEPFLAPGMATLGAAFDLGSGGPQLPQRQQQERARAIVPAIVHRATVRRQALPRPQHWTVIGPREHHLGTPPPPAR